VAKRVIILYSMWEYKTPKPEVPLEVLHKKRGVGP
jgi:hypothetical protein